MIVTCRECYRRFDDECRTTICPHGTFAANDGHNNFRHYPDSFLESVIPTKEKLARALRFANAPSQMVTRALAGEYDDYESPSATPSLNLIYDLKTAGLPELVAKAMNGEFDGTKEEGQAWFEREGKDLLS